MPLPRSVLVLTAAGAAVLAGAAPALAGPPGTWTAISGPGVDFHTQPGLHRTADGTLHVAIEEKTGATSSIEVAHVSPSGALTGRSAAIDRLTSSLQLDTSRIRRVLGWQPPHTTRQGLEATAAWYRSRDTQN